MKRVYRQGCIICRIKPSETSISGETGMPAAVTVDTAVQSCETMERRGLERLRGVEISAHQSNTDVMNQLTKVGNVTTTIDNCAIPVSIVSNHTSRRSSDDVPQKDIESSTEENIPNQLTRNGIFDAAPGNKPRWDESSNSPSAGRTPSCASVKSEPQDIIEIDALDDEEGRIDYSADSLDDESVAMESGEMYDGNDYDGSGGQMDEWVDGNRENIQQR